MASQDAVFKFASGFSNSLDRMIQKIDNMNSKLGISNQKIIDFNRYLKDTENNVYKINVAFNDVNKSLSKFDELGNKLGFLNKIKNQKSQGKGDSKLQSKDKLQELFNTPLNKILQSYSEGISKRPSNKSSKKQSKKASDNSSYNDFSNFNKQLLMGTNDKIFEEAISEVFNKIKGSKGITNITKDITNLLETIGEKTPSVIKKVSKYMKEDTKFAKFTKGASGVGQIAKGASKVAGKTIIGSIPSLVMSGVNIANAPKDKRGRVIAGEAGGWLAGAASGAAAGAALGAMGLNPITIALGSVVGGAVGAVGGEKAATAIYDNKNKIAKWFSQTKENLGKVNGMVATFATIGGKKIGTAIDNSKEKINKWFSNNKNNRGIGFNIGSLVGGTVGGNVGGIAGGIVGGAVGSKVGSKAGNLVGGAVGAIGGVAGVKVATAIYDNKEKIAKVFNESRSDLSNFGKRFLPNTSRVNEKTSPILSGYNTYMPVSYDNSMLHKVDMKGEEVSRLRNITKNNDKPKLVKLNPKISITFGDVRETADVNKIAKKLKSILREEIKIASEGAYA